MKIKIKGFSLLECIIGVTISGFIVLLSLGLLVKVSKISKNLKYDNYGSNNIKIHKLMEELILKTTIETENKELKGENIGFKILKTSGVYLNGLKWVVLKNYIIPIKNQGDTLYIEESYLKSEDPMILSNNFHIFRFVTIGGDKKQQQLVYIKGITPGSLYIPVNLGMEEVILTKVYNGNFIEIRGGVIMNYTTENNEVIRKTFLRRGEL